MLIGLDTGEGGGEGEEERESHSKVGTLLGPTIISDLGDQLVIAEIHHHATCVSLEFENIHSS